jgi:tetratricopeptide (TPR) repeat protein
MPRSHDTLDIATVPGCRPPEGRVARIAYAPRVTLPKTLWLTVSGLSLLVAVSTYAQDIEWADAMKAAERALNESRYEEAEQYLRTAVRYAETFKPGDRRLDRTFSALATLLYSRGNYAEAERVYLDAWRGRSGPSISGWPTVSRDWP